MKKLLLIAAALCVVLAMAGCNQTPTPEPPADSDPIANVDPGTPGETTPEDDTLPDYLAGLTKDEYEGLVLTAAVLERKAILPGFAITVSVSVQNTGDKAVVFVHGSGSRTIPEAITGDAEHLQYVIPRDHMGFATMDYRVDEIKPGETLTFDLVFMAIEPSADFNDYTHEQFAKDQTYIADMSWEDISAAYPELVATEPGSYEAYVYFRYALAGEGGMASLFAEATGYAEAVVPIGVS